MRTPNSSKSTRLATISTLGAMMFGASFVASSPAVASDTQNAYYDHHRMCVELLFSDTEAHADNCLPSRIVPSLGSPSKMSSGEPRKRRPPQCYVPTSSFAISVINECDYSSDDL